MTRKERATIEATICIMHDGHDAWESVRCYRGRGRERGAVPSHAAAHVPRLGLVCTPGVKPLPHGWRWRHLAAFQPTQMPLMEPELLRRLNLGQA